MLGAEIVRGLRGKAESPDAIIQFVFPLVLIAERDGVVGIELIVEARAETGAGARTGNRVRKFDRVEARVQHRRIDDGKFVDVSAIEVDEEGRLFVDGAAEVSIVHLGIVPRLRRGARKWIARVQAGGIAVNHELAVEFVGTGLGKHFNSSEAEVIVFRGKWILIDANFTNGRFGWQLTARETVDINLSAVWSGGRPGERLPFFAQFVGIVGQRVEILAFENHRAGVAGAGNVELRPGVLHFDFFFLHGNFELHVHAGRFSSFDRYARLCEWLKSFGYCANRVDTRRQRLEFIEAIRIRASIDRLSARRNRDDTRIRHRRPRRIRDNSRQGAG